MTLRGKAHKLGDNVSTDIHASAKYKAVGISLEQLVSELFADLDPELPKRVRPGDIVVAGEVFGMVSSREDAALVMKTAGFSAVLAKSFGNLFYRNAINLGLPALEGNTDGIETDDDIEIDLTTGRVTNHTKGTTLQATVLPEPILKLIEDGGLVEHLKKHGDFAVA